MKSIKNMLVTSLVFCIMAFSLVGCFNKKVIVATINGESISEQLYRINLWSTQRSLEAIEEHLWDLENIYGKSPGEFVKAKTLEAITYRIVVKQKVQELNIKLNKEDKAKVKEAAKTAMKENEAFAKEYGIRQSDYEEYYTFAAQNEKVIALLAKNYEPNEEEVNEQINLMRFNGQCQDQATIVHILFATINELGEEIPSDKKEEAYNSAQEILKKALAGNDMSMLATEYSDDPRVAQDGGKYTFKRGEGLGEVIDKVVFEEAEVGKVYPKVVKTDMGYEVLKVLSVETESQESLSERAKETIKNRYAQQELQELTQFSDVQTNEAYDEIYVGPNELQKNGAE